MSDDPKTRAAFAEIRKIVGELHRSHSPDTGTVYRLMSALLDHLDPQSTPPPYVPPAQVYQPGQVMQSGTVMSGTVKVK